MAEWTSTSEQALFGGDYPSDVHVALGNWGWAGLPRQGVKMSAFDGRRPVEVAGRTNVGFRCAR